MQRDNAKTITRNSFWYAVDASAATIVMLIASVPVARVMGPEVLGHYIFLVFMTTIAQRLR
jgi:O-antigen/teichoic acid export membrane protein